MNLAEALGASLVLVIGCSSSAQLWNQGVRATAELAQREEQMDRLESLLVASEGTARQLARVQQAPAANCQAASDQLVEQLQALPLAQASTPPATLTLPQPPGPGLLHLRWEAGGVQRERLLSLSAVGLCREGSHAP
ncbi:MAG: hypothetical protein ACO3ZD_12825 [Cyanobium sp.]